MWLDLTRGILEEFAAAARLCDPGMLMRGSGSALHIICPNARRTDADRVQYAAGKRQRIRVLRAEAVAGKVCRRASCGKPVARPVKPGPIPDYCSSGCMRRAKWLRWRETHRGADIRRKREARRAS